MKNLMFWRLQTTWF